MNQAQFFSHSIKRLCNNKPLLPAEYQPVEYIEASGTQRINTGVSISSSLETHIVAQMTAPNYFGSLAGGRNARSSNGRYIPFGIGDSNDYRLRCCYGSYDLYINSPRASTVLEIIYNDVSHKMYVNGSQVANFGSANFSDNSPVTLCLFTLNGYDGNGSYNFHGAGKIWSVTLYNNSTGDKLGDFIPCYRKSDNKPGMYDLVTTTFFTNIGTGEFTVGNNV